MENNLNVYLIYQDDNIEYDTYDKAVVIASNEEEARRIHPSAYFNHEDFVSQTGGPWYEGEEINYSWTSPENVKVVKLGIFQPNIPGDLKTLSPVICASFNAG
tara:strand:- start:127 stop:435 length:309 start_codon:yes stop_codon:yes gene_type:complete